MECQEPFYLLEKVPFEFDWNFICVFSDAFLYPVLRFVSVSKGGKPELTYSKIDCFLLNHKVNLKYECKTEKLTTTKN